MSLNGRFSFHMFVSLRLSIPKISWDTLIPQHFTSKFNRKVTIGIKFPNSPSKEKDPLLIFCQTVSSVVDLINLSFNRLHSKGQPILPHNSFPYSRIHSHQTHTYLPFVSPLQIQESNPTSSLISMLALLKEHRSSNSPF